MVLEGSQVGRREGDGTRFPGVLCCEMQMTEWEKSMDQSDLGFDLLASSLRADARDLKSFMEALAVKMEGALPERTRVERKGGGLFSRQPQVHRITLDMGDNRYELVAEGGRIEPRRAKAVRGIVLKTEQLPLEQWIDDVSQWLAAEAEHSEQARLALQRLLEG
jgi:hypothetical protein